MKYPWLYVGAKVTPVRFGPEARAYGGHDRVVDGSVYTVRGVVPCQGGHLGIRLEGVRGCNHPIFGADCPWLADAFRPVLPDTSKQVEAMRSLMLDAVVRGKVEA
jgi:hypothetical protein